MTGGTVLVLGPIGRNFAAGMSGGVAYVLDLPTERVNGDLVDVLPLRPQDCANVQSLLALHRDETGSPVAEALLANWDTAQARFSLVLPRDYQRVLDIRAAAESEGLDLDGDQVWDKIMEASRG